MALLPLFEVLDWAEITQPFLCSPAVIENFDVFEDRLPGLLASLVTSPVDGFVFQDGNEAFDSGIIAWFADPREVFRQP